MDEALVAYLRDQWPALVRASATLRAEDANAESVLRLAIVRGCARRRRAESTPDAERFVRRLMVQACIADGMRRVRDDGDALTVDVTYPGGPADQDREDRPADRVRTALRGLPPRQRVALVLRYLDELDDPAAADLIGCSESALRIVRRDGLDALVSVLGTDPFDAVTGDGTSRTEALLRASLARTPDVAMTAADPLIELGTRIKRLRHRRVTLATAAVSVVVVAAVAAAVAGSGSSPRPSAAAVVRTQPVHVSPLRPPPAPVEIPHAAGSYPVAVASGGGSLWTLELHPSSRRGGTTIVRRSAASGAAERSYPVQGEDFFLAYGVGRVWAWGNAGRGEPTHLTELDPTKGAVRRISLARGVGLRSVAFTRGSAWFTEPALDRVLLVARALHRTPRTIAVPRPTLSVAVSPSSVLVSRAGGILHVLPANNDVEPGELGPTLLASAPRFGVWVGHGRLLDYHSAAGVAIIVRLQLAHPATQVVGDPFRGVYVATRSTRAANFGPYLVYYAPAAATSRLPEATAQLGGHVRVESLTARPGGGVVFVTSTGAIESWDVAGA